MAGPFAAEGAPGAERRAPEIGTALALPPSGAPISSVLNSSISGPHFAHAEASGSSPESGAAFSRAVTIRIRFAVPRSLRRVSGARFHTRRFDGVPLPVARAIVSDAVAYAKRPDERSREAMYRYRPAEKPQSDGQPTAETEAGAVSLPLDFEEVASLAVTAPAAADDAIVLGSTR